MMKSTRTAAFWLAITFLAGALFGFMARSLYPQRTARAANQQSHRERYLSKLQRELTLSPEQLTQVTAIVDQTDQRFKDVKERMEADSEVIRQEHRRRIMTLLTPEQQPKYQKVIEEFRRKQAEGRSKR